MKGDVPAVAVGLILGYEGVGGLILEFTGKKGAETAVEAVGVPATFELCD